MVVGRVRPLQSTLVASDRRRGRPPVTSRRELEHVGLHLFATQGFEATTVDEIAEAVGVSRRTFFRYFPAKADLVWGDFEAAVYRMRKDLGSMPGDVPLMDALRLAVVQFNRLSEDDIPQHRERMRLILEVPEVIARSPLRYETWRLAIDDFVAQRLRLDRKDLLPRTIGYCALGAAVAAYEQWLRHDDIPIEDLLERGFRTLALGFATEVDIAVRSGQSVLG